MRISHVFAVVVVVVVAVVATNGPLLDLLCLF